MTLADPAVLRGPYNNVILGGRANGASLQLSKLSLYSPITLLPSYPIPPCLSKKEFSEEYLL